MLLVALHLITGPLAVVWAGRPAAVVQRDIKRLAPSFKPTYFLGLKTGDPRESEPVRWKYTYCLALGIKVPLFKYWR